MNKMKYKVLSKLQGNSSMKLLYGYLLDNEETEITILYRRLGKEVGMKKSTVGYNMRKLKNAGVLKIQGQYSEDGARLANKYIME